MANKSAPVPTQGLSAGNKALDPVVQYDGVIFSVASRGPAAFNSGGFSNPNRLGVRLYINLTVVNGGVLNVKIQNFDPASQTWVDMPLATTAPGGLSAVAVTTMTVYPGVAETTSVDIADPLGSLWRVVATTTTAAVTFGVGGEYLG